MHQNLKLDYFFFNKRKKGNKRKMNNLTSGMTFEEKFDGLLQHFDDNGKATIRRRYDAEQKIIQMAEEEYKGRQLWKKHIEKIKDEAPAKTLDMLMKVQTSIDVLYGDGQISETAFETLNNLIANVDNDNNLFTRFTELMDICNYTDPKPAARMNPVVRQQLTEAEKLRRANSPEYPCWTQCKRCNRVMTTKYYNSGHKKSQVCGQITKTKMVSLENNAFYKEGDGLRQAKLIDPDNFNASSENVNWGDQSKLEMKEV